jgi:chromosome segregation ATPase
MIIEIRRENEGHLEAILAHEHLTQELIVSISALETERDVLLRRNKELEEILKEPYTIIRELEKANELLRDRIRSQQERYRNRVTLVNDLLAQLQGRNAAYSALETRYQLLDTRERMLRNEYRRLTVRYQELYVEYQILSDMCQGVLD